MTTAKVITIATAVVVAASCGGDDGPTNPPGGQTGTISGSVVAEGAGVQGAQVALAGGATRTTDSGGDFTFTGVSAGSHTLTLTLPTGFELGAGQTLERSVNVTAGQTASVNWTLVPGEPQTTEVDTVRIVGTSFSPSSLTIAPGRTVVWVNTGSGGHTVTPDGHSEWNRATTNSEGEVLRVTFGSEGTFPYYCEPHRSIGMTGEIRVQQ